MFYWLSCCNWKIGPSCLLKGFSLKMAVIWNWIIPSNFMLYNSYISSLAMTAIGARNPKESKNFAYSHSKLFVCREICLTIKMVFSCYPNLGLTLWFLIYRKCVQRPFFNSYSSRMGLFNKSFPKINPWFERQLVTWDFCCFNFICSTRGT